MILDRSESSECKKDGSTVKSIIFSMKSIIFSMKSITFSTKHRRCPETSPFNHIVVGDRCAGARRPATQTQSQMLR